MERLYKKGLHLEYFTVGYNVIEAIVSITFGRIANSIALVGFGLDSIVESLSGLVLIWRLNQHKRISYVLFPLIIALFLFKEGLEGWEESE
ncbi:MAG: hypothetical protein ABIL39_05340 [candidate division WOR-3 bacterium]